MGRDDDQDLEIQASRKAKTDLETLIDTSPVGVVVFDGKTGAPVSINREIRRIVDGLLNPDQRPEQLLEVLTVRRADGTEISLEELPLAQALSEGDTVRAEEIVLRVPDGRSVRALLNATPIRSEEGSVESYVAVLQDLTPLEKQERLRAEFLALVSHELRLPLSSVKGSVVTLLDPPAPLNPAEMQQFHRIIDNQIDSMHELISDLLDVARIETGALAIAPEPTDVALLAREARNAFRSSGRHPIDIDLAADLPWVMADRARLAQVLGTLLANAGRNSPESSTIRVSAVRDGIHVAVAVADAPVIFLSAHGLGQLVARALDQGAADYLVKPFSPVELAARIRAALRRDDTPEPIQPYVLGDLTIDFAQRRVSLAGRHVPLTAIEYRTLAELSANADRVLTYGHLLRRVWRLNADADLRPMRTAISSLRRKLGDDADDPTYIFTELRVGYRMPKGEKREPDEG